MTSANQAPSEDWAGLADLEESQRTQEMLSRVRTLLGMPPEQRQATLKSIAEQEYALPEDKLRSLTIARMRIMLALNDEEARTYIDDYDAVMRQMPATAAMRRVGLVQTLAMEFTAEEEDRLRAMMPNVFAGAPRRRGALDVPEAAAAPPRKRPFWAFWQKG